MVYDVAVVGLGVMGAATAYECAARGARVVAVEQFTPPHAFGSSHGRTRIIREAYFEHPLYVPLVRRAYERWLRLERDAQRPLLVRTGGVMVGPADGALVRGSLRSAREHEVAHELIDGERLPDRFAGLRAVAGHVAVFERNAGLLLAEACVAALLDGARAYGAALRSGTRVLGWDAGDGGVSIRTAASTLRARAVVIAAGAWLPELLGEATPPVRIERQVFHWYAARRGAARFTADALPVGIYEYEPARYVATFSDVGDGVKIGIHHEGEETTPQTIDRTPRPADEHAARPLLERFLADAAWALRDAAVCMYTNTPDDHFIVDAQPATPRAVIVSACSGHGFKFAPAIGELAADLALEGGSARDIAAFSLARFG
jgi:sarcosine oxidase